MASKNDYYDKEKCIFWTVLILFEVSYLSRFLFDVNAARLYANNLFAYLILEDLVLSFDSITFLFLLLVHFKNFKVDEKSTSVEDATSSRHGSLSFSVDEGDVSKIKLRMTNTPSNAGESIVLLSGGSPMSIDNQPSQAFSRPSDDASQQASPSIEAAGGSAVNLPSTLTESKRL